MKIVLDSIIFELQKAGGISIIWAKFIQYLKDQGCNFISIESSKATENIFRKEVELSKRELLPDRYAPQKVRRYLKAPVISGDIFHSSYYRIPSVKNIKQIVTVHDFIYELTEKNPLKRKIHCYQKYKALKNADVIICVSHHTKRDLLRFYPDISSKRIEVIYNGVDDSFFQISEIPSEIFIKGNRLSKQKFVLYVGGRGRCKNFGMAMELMQSTIFKDLDLQMICIGGGAFSKHELELFSKHNLKLPVHLGHVNSIELNQLYNMAYCLFFPSLYEGFGIPPLEAMKAGCPVLAARSSSIPEVVGPQALLFDPRDQTNMIDAFKSLGSDVSRKQIVAEGVLRSKLFSWDKTFSSVSLVYATL